MKLDNGRIKFTLHVDPRVAGALGIPADSNGRPFGLALRKYAKLLEQAARKNEDKFTPAQWEAFQRALTPAALEEYEQAGTGSVGYLLAEAITRANPKADVSRVDHLAGIEAEAFVVAIRWAHENKKHVRGENLWYTVAYRRRVTAEDVR